MGEVNGEGREVEGWWGGKARGKMERGGKRGGVKSWGEGKGVGMEKETRKKGVRAMGRDEGCLDGGIRECGGLGRRKAAGRR